LQGKRIEYWLLYGRENTAQNIGFIRFVTSTTSFGPQMGERRTVGFSPRMGHRPAIGRGEVGRLAVAKALII
jgi:hypothetical protein